MKALAIGLALTALLALGLVVAAVSGAFDDDASSVRTASSARLKVDRFDGRRAFAELRRQVELGPRPAGSATSRRLAARMRRALPRGRYEKVPRRAAQRRRPAARHQAGGRRRGALRHEEPARLRRRE